MFLIYTRDHFTGRMCVAKAEDMPCDGNGRHAEHERAWPLTAGEFVLPLSVLEKLYPGPI